LIGDWQSFSVSFLFLQHAGQRVSAFHNKLYPGTQTAFVTPELLAAAQEYLHARRETSQPPAQLLLAWETFYRICDPLVRRTIARRRVPRNDLDDSAQDAWNEINASLVDFVYDPGRGRFESWLRTVVERSVWRHLSRNDCRKPHQVDINLNSVRCLQSFEPSLALTREEFCDAVLAALRTFRGRVSEKSFQVLHLRLVEGRSVAEIAKLLDLSAGHVRVLQHRAMARFRRFLGVSESLAAEWLE
jgi:RNA polymerase sigma factor (sigma-70 family)